MIPTIGFSPLLKKLISEQLQKAPDQEKFFIKRFSNLSNKEVSSLNNIADLIYKIIGNELDSYTYSYSWYCEKQLEEELFFRRNKKYRLNNFNDANAEVYSNHEYMCHYMKAMLLTQIWWTNHFNSLNFYLNNFLNDHLSIISHKEISHLDIGPGHGLYLYFASLLKNVQLVEGWDISSTSIELCKMNLKKLGVKKIPHLKQNNIFNNSNTKKFDSIVLSEVLEHMEHPSKALAAISDVLKKNGVLFLNMPINSPAPDHLVNFEKPSLLKEYLIDNNFDVLDERYFAATNQTYDDCLKHNLTIQCCFILRKKND